jgi:hypothetical protein
LVVSLPCTANVSSEPLAGAVSAPRTRTPADLKWLLNERAAVAGAIETSLGRKVQIENHLARAQQQVAELVQALAGASGTLATKQVSLAALDRTIALAYASVAPWAGGVIKAWAGKYGQRGGLQEFVVQALKGVAPQPITTLILMSHAANHFGLTLATPQDRKKFRNSVRSILRGLQAKGIVEALHKQKGKVSGAWCWAGDRVPSMADLAAIQAGAAHDRDPGPHPHPP